VQAAAGAAIGCDAARSKGCRGGGSRSERCVDTAPANGCARTTSGALRAARRCRTRSSAASCSDG